MGLLRMDLRKDGRILYISSIDISRADGPGINEREFTVELCNVFGERAHILVPEPKNPLEDVNGRNFSFCKGHQHYKPLAFFQHQLSQIRWADILIKSGKFNFLIFRINILPLNQIYISRRYKIPYAIKTLGAGLINILGQRGGMIGKVLKPFNEKLVKDLTARATAIDVCTEVYASFFPERLSLDPLKVRWIENATNTDRFHLIDKATARSVCGLSAFEPIVGFVGSLPWERGGTQMLEIAPRLLSQYPTLGIVIVGGEGGQLDRLRQQALELGIAAHCVLPGVVPYERVPYFINAFDVGISFDTTTRLTQIGNSSQKVRQYIACGKPVVSGPGGNLFLEEEGLGTIVNPDDIDQITNAVNKWLSLTDREKEAHSHRAVNYAQKHLSISKALNDRLEFWNERLQIVGQE